LADAAATAVCCGPAWKVRSTFGNFILQVGPSAAGLSASCVWVNEKETPVSC
jgi:hypothetical protein